MAAASEKLVVVWTSSDKEVALEMVFMYTLNAKLRGWWDDITFVLWGPSEKLMASDLELQGRLRKMMNEGIVAEACRACSDDYGITEKLEKLGIDVRYMGVPLTEYIKEGRHVLTF